MKIKLGQRIQAGYRAVAMLLLNTLLLMAGVEFAATVTLHLVNTPTIKGWLANITGEPNDLIAFYKDLPFYAGQEWSEQYWREHSLVLRKEYYPYVIWRSPQFTGEMINIGPGDIRSTPGAECGQDAWKVYVFGGSAIWGWGAPDWGTIPAYLQAELAAYHDGPVCVINFGENAYVSTQDLIELILLLEAGDIPDLVILYDGVNEVLAASQNGRSTFHQNLSEIRNRFQSAKPGLIAVLKASSTFTLLQQVASTAGLMDTAAVEEVPTIIDSERLKNEIVEAYLNNRKTVEALAKGYGFDYHLFWQPHILAGQKPLTVEEQNMITGLDWVVQMSPVLVELFQDSYERIEAEALADDHLHYLGNVFDDEETQLWIDTWGHVTPQGNRLIAREMRAIIEHQLPD